MTPQELKNSILIKAFSGRLVKQLVTDGTADEMLAIIKAKKVSAETELDDIPETWRWTYLPDIANVLYGFPFNSEKFNEESIGMPLIRIRDILGGKTKTYTDEPCDEGYRIKYGDMLVGMDGNFQVDFWQSEDAWLNQRVCKITAIDSFLCQRYLFYYLPIILKEINSSVSYSTVKHLSAKILNNMLIPLPPLAEQKRIVAKIEELLPLIDRYEEAWTKLEEFNKRFPGDMQKSLLQMAIQGKLVEQRPEEGTGEELYQQIQKEKQKLIKEGKIKKDKRTETNDICINDVPFDIPETWKWTSLGSILNKLTDGTHKTPRYATAGVKFVSVKDISSGKLSLDNTKYITIEEHNELFSRCNPECGDMLLSKVGTTGVPAVVDTKEPFSLFVSVALLKYNHNCIDENFLYYLLKSPLVQMQASENTRGVGNKNWVLDAIANTMIVIPPLAEQKRIVAKLEQLLPLCERLK